VKVLWHTDNINTKSRMNGPRRNVDEQRLQAPLIIRDRGLGICTAPTLAPLSTAASTLLLHWSTLHDSTLVANPVSLLSHHGLTWPAGQNPLCIYNTSRKPTIHGGWLQHGHKNLLLSRATCDVHKATRLAATGYRQHHQQVLWDWECRTRLSE